MSKNLTDDVLKKKLPSGHRKQACRAAAAPFPGHPAGFSTKHKVEPCTVWQQLSPGRQRSEGGVTAVRPQRSAAPGGSGTGAGCPRPARSSQKPFGGGLPSGAAALQQDRLLQPGRRAAHDPGPAAPRGAPCVAQRRSVPHAAAGDGTAAAFCAPDRGSRERAGVPLWRRALTFGHGPVRSRSRCRRLPLPL